MKLAVGKEWWGGAHWDLRGAIQGFVAANKDNGAGTSTWTTLGGGAVFRATYN